MAPKDTTYYDVLGVKPSATAAEVRKAFRLKALQLHPDRNGGSGDDAARATAAFQQLKAVYDVLADPERRAQHDEFGPPSNPHADDGAAPDAASLAELVRRYASRLSKQDVAAYEQTYRDGADEREDLLAHFRRFDGDVQLVLEYIPYSGEGDVRRFVSFWDEQIEQGELQSCERYEAARAQLLKNADEWDRKNNNKNKNKNKRQKGGKAGKASGRGDAAADVSALTALIQQRAQRAKGKFDAWCEDIEHKAQLEEAGARRSGRSKTGARAKGRAKRPARASGTRSPPAANGGVSKARKSRR